MTNELKAQIALTADAEGVEVGVGKAKRSIASLGQAAAQAGKAGADGLSGIGTGSEEASKKVDRATQNLVTSIQRTIAATEAGDRSNRKYFEYLANQRGASTDVLKPYLAQLDEVNARTRTLGVSAGQTTQALRQLPAQFTDIVTSLQAGQAPLTVLLQQGGQIKDSFGGAGAAAQALGRYVLSLIGPYTLLAGAALGVVAAYAAGAKEAEAYNQAIILSGNAAGTTAGQLQGYAKSISAVIGTQGAAAEAVAAFAESGSVASANLEKVSRAALTFEKATGTAIDKTVKQFEELGKSPLDAAIKLDEKYNFLTTSVYRQIKALEDQGRATEAANLAQNTFADTIESRGNQILQNIGYIERAWNAVKGAIKGAVDAAKEIGRDSTVQDQIAILEQQIKQRQERNTGLGIADGEATKQLQAQLAALQATAYAQKANADAIAAGNVQTKARIQFDKDGEQYLSKREKLEKEIVKARNEGIAAGASELEILTRIDKLRQSEKFKESGAAGTGQNEVAAIRARVLEQQQYLQSLQQQIADDSKRADISRLTDGEKLVIKINEELKTSITGVARAQKERALAAAKEQAAVDLSVVASERQLKAVNSARDAYSKLVESTGNSAEKIREQANSQEAVNEQFGKNKTAIEQATLAQIKLSLAEAEASDRFAPQYVAALTAKAEAQERFVAALQKSEFQQAQLKLTEAGRTAIEDTVTLQVELSLLGQSQQVRERILGQRKAEVQLAKELAAIDKLNLGEGTEADDRRQQLRAQARANYTVEANNAATRSVVNEWQRASDLINQSLTDALLRGFESGKGFVENFVDTIKNLFKTLVLRPIISAVVSPITGAATSAFGIPGVANAATGGGGVSNLLNLGSNLSTAYSAFTGSFITSIGSAATAAGNLFGSSAIAEFGLGLQGLALPSSTGALAAGGSAASALSSVASVAPYALAAVAVLNALGVFRSKKIVDGGLQGELGGQVNDYALQRKGGTLFSGPSYSVIDRGASAQNQALQDSYNAIRTTVAGMAEQLGVGNEAIKAFTVQLGNDLIHPDTGGFGIKTQGLTQDEIIAKIEASLLSANEQLAAFALGTTDFTRDGETAVQTLGRLSGSLGSVNSVFKTLGLTLADASLISADAASKFLDSFGGADQFAQVASSYYQNFYTEAERTANTVEALRQRFFELGTAGATTREGFRALVEEQQRLNGATSPVVAELLKLESTFASVVPAIDAVSQAAAQQAEQAKQQAAAIASDRSDRLRAERELAASAKAAAEEVSKLNEQNYRLAISAGNIGKAIASSNQTGPRFADYQGPGGFNAAGYNAANIAAQQRSYQQVLADTQRQNPFEVADYFGVISELQRNIASLTDNLNSGEFNGGSSSIEQAAQQAFGGFLNPEQIQAAADGLTSFSNVLSLVSGTAAQGAIGADQALRVLEGAYTGVSKQSVEYARGLEIIGQSVGVATGNLQDIQAAIQSGLDYFNSGEYYQAIAQEQLRVQVQFTSRAFTALTQRAASFNVETGNLETSFDVLDGFIGRLKSVQDAFANAAGDRAAEASLISDAARRIGEIITTPVAEAARNALADLPSFAGLDNGKLRDLSLLLKDLGQYDNAGLEKTFIRVSDALASGSVTAAQYADLIAYTESVYLGTATALDAVAEAGASAVDVLRERQGLEQRILQLQGNTAELRRLELEALDPSNRALQQFLNMLEDTIQLSNAFDAVRQSARSLSAQLLADNNLNAFGSKSALAEAARQYRESLAGAFEGDQKAASDLNSAAKNYLDLVRDTATNELEYRRAFATTLNDLNRLSLVQTPGSPVLGPSTAPQLPIDVPASPAPSSASISPPSIVQGSEFKGMQQELTALRELVTRLLVASETNLPAVAEHTAATASVLRRVTRNGNALVTTTE